MIFWVETINMSIVYPPTAEESWTDNSSQNLNLWADKTPCEATMLDFVYSASLTLWIWVHCCRYALRMNNGCGYLWEKGVKVEIHVFYLLGMRSAIYLRESGLYWSENCNGQTNFGDAELLRTPIYIHQRRQKEVKATTSTVVIRDTSTWLIVK